MSKRPQVGGNHYQRFAIEPIDFIMKNKLSFAEGCVIKYVCRWRHKNGVEDLLKARQYIDFLLEEAGAEIIRPAEPNDDEFVIVAGCQVPVSELE